MTRLAILGIPPLLWGLLAGWWTPRGPLTGVQALTSVAVSAAIGLAAARASRSRWVFLVVPALFVVALELTRAGFRGPSADAPHASLFGVAVLLAGRGVQGLLTVLPTLLAVAYGRGVAGRLRRIVVAVPTAGVLLFATAAAVPARTAPIPGADSVAELARVGRLGVLIRGTHVTAPVLLFVPGAPGGSEFGTVREHLAGLEQRFVTVTMDRRGGGSSYPALDPTGAVTLAGSVGDVLRVTDYLRARFHQQKIYLLAHSGGSILGVLAVQRHPEKFAAYIGTGQAVDLPASDRIFYTDIQAWAHTHGHEEVARRLAAQGPPPWPGVWSYEPFLTYENEAFGQRTGGFGLGVREFTLLQKVHLLNALLDSWDVLYPRMQGVDLRRDVPRLAVPVWFVQGGNEMRGLAVVFDQWYAALQAPQKHLTVVPGAGHRVLFEEPDRFAAVLDQVLMG
jgi:pimeloyl-ACP methyl ester carboxylesterase